MHYVKDSSTKNWKCVQYVPQIPLEHLVLGNFSARGGRKDIFQTITGNESLHEVNNNSGDRAVHTATSKYPTVKSTMFLQCNIQHTWASPDGKTLNQIDYILIERQRY
jgi:hypothetical protein